MSNHVQKTGAVRATVVDCEHLRVANAATMATVGLRAGMTPALPIAPNTFTYIVFNVVDYDTTSGDYDAGTGTFTNSGAAGIFHVVAHATIDTNPATGATDLSIQCSSGQSMTASTNSSAAGTRQTMLVSGYFSVATGQTLRIGTRNTTAGYTLLATADRTSLMIQRV